MTVSRPSVTAAGSEVGRCPRSTRQLSDRRVAARALRTSSAPLPRAVGRRTGVAAGNGFTTSPGRGQMTSMRPPRACLSCLPSPQPPLLLPRATWAGLVGRQAVEQNSSRAVFKLSVDSCSRWAGFCGEYGSPSRTSRAGRAGSSRVESGHSQPAGRAPSTRKPGQGVMLPSGHDLVTCDDPRLIRWQSAAAAGVTGLGQTLWLIRREVCHSEASGGLSEAPEVGDIKQTATVVHPVRWSVLHKSSSTYSKWLYQKW